MVYHLLSILSAEKNAMKYEEKNTVGSQRRKKKKDNQRMSNTAK